MYFKNASSRGFSLVELLATIAVMAAVIAIAMFFVAGYVQWAQFESDHQTYFVLNDALNRYKGGGGNMSALTLGAPPGDVLTALETPVSWGAGVGNSGISHQFLATGYTYPARSLTAVGNGATYQFCQVGSYNNGSAPGLGVPTSKYPLGQGVAYISNGGAGSYIFAAGGGTLSTTGYFAVKNSAGTVIVYTNNFTAPTSNYLTLWSCVGPAGADNGANSKPSGLITNISVNTTSYPVTSFDFSNGLTSLSYVYIIPTSSSSPTTCTQTANLSGCTALSGAFNMFSNVGDAPVVNLTNCTGITSFNNMGAYLTSLNLTGCSNLTSVGFPASLTSYSLTGCNSLASIGFAGTTMTSLDFSNLPSLQSITGSGAQLTSVNLSNCPQLATITMGMSGLLSTITFTNCPLLSYVDIHSNNLSAAALNAIYTVLPDRTGQTTGTIYAYGNPGFFSSTTSIATAKNWVF